MIFAHLGKRTGVFGKAGSAESRTGLKVLHADAAIQADAGRNVADPSIHFFAQVRHFIDKGDLGCQ